MPALKGIACTLFFLYTQNIGALDDNTKVIQKPTSFRRSYYLHVERQIATSPIQEGYLSSTLNYIIILVFKELTTREVMTYTCFSQQAKVEGSNVGALCLSGKRSAQSFQDLGKKLKMEEVKDRSATTSNCANCSVPNPQLLWRKDTMLHISQEEMGRELCCSIWRKSRARQPGFETELKDRMARVTTIHAHLVTCHLACSSG